MEKINLNHIAILKIQIVLMIKYTLKKRLPISGKYIKVFVKDFIKENIDWNEIICF